MPWLFSPWAPLLVRTSMPQLLVSRSNIVLEAQRRLILLHWSCGKDFANRVREPKRHGKPVPANACVEIQLREVKYVLENGL